MFSLACAVFFVGMLASALGAPTAPNFTLVDQAINQAVVQRVFPGATYLIGDKNGTVLHQRATGSFTYGRTPPHDPPGTVPKVQLDTLFDLASLSKVTAATGACATFYERGELPLETRVADVLGEGFAKEGKGEIRVLNLLLHNAGFPPDPTPDFWDPAFGCPATKEDHPPLTFSCGDQILEGVFSQTLINPVGHVYVYSDLSMITMHFVIGAKSKELGYTTKADLSPDCQKAVEEYQTGVELTCHYDAYVRKHVFGKVGMESSGFRPDPSIYGKIPPTWQDDVYRHELLQGVVSDGNSYANAGISGHAGVFATVDDLSKLAYAWIAAPTDEEVLSGEAGNFLINKTTATLFMTQYNASQSSRALGWDTNSPENTYNECGNMSTRTFCHTGYNGPVVCIDPENQFYTFLLDHRVYPNKTGNEISIRTTRRTFANLTMGVLQHWA